MYISSVVPVAAVVNTSRQTKSQNSRHASKTPFVLHTCTIYSLLYIPSQIRAVIQLILREAITHESKAVARAVADIEVLCADALDHVVEQHGAAGERGRHAPVDAVVLVPGPTCAPK